MGGGSTSTSWRAASPSPTRRRWPVPTPCWTGWPMARGCCATGWRSARMPDAAVRHGSRLCLVALVHHPLALETGLAPAAAAALAASERTALAATRGVVVTSPATAAGLADYGVSRDRIAVVEPGIDRAARSRGTRAADATADVELLCVASLVPRKGHLLLLEALARLRHLPWRLTCVGSPELDPDAAARVHAARRRAVASPAGSRSPARRSAPTSIARTSGPTPSCWRPTTRATAWPWPRRWRAACRWSARTPAPPRRWSAPIRRDRPSGRRRGADRGAGPSHRRRRQRAVLARGAAARAATLRTWPQAAAVLRRRCWAPAVESFSADWLALREPADTAARSESLTRLAGQRLGERDRVRAIDLACGTGANVRYLASRLPMPADWTLVDHDRALLDEARRRLRHGALGDDFTLTARVDRSRAVRCGDPRRPAAGHGGGAARSGVGGVARIAGRGVPPGRRRGPAGADLRRTHRLHARASR